jgi:hypothetical protein
MSARSATEVVERMKELAQNLGSAFGRLINETMIPIVTKMLQVLDQKGMINLPLKINGLEVKIAPVAPLAQAQSMEEVDNVLKFAQIAQAMGQAGQMAIKQDEMIDFIAEKLNVPQRILNSPIERAMLQQQAMMMAQQASQEAPEVADQVAGAMAEQAIQEG